MNSSFKKSILLAITAAALAGFGLFGAKPALAWYDANYQYRRQLTINASQVSTTADAFTIVGSTTQGYLKSVANGGKVAQANGYDIIFVDDDDATLLDFEIESWDASTGALTAWIEHAVSSTSDEYLYMYYGYSGASDVSDHEAAWGSLGEVGVWHLSETPTVDSYAYDSTLNNNDGTFNGSMTTGDQVDGQLDGSIDFDGSDDYVDMGANTFSDSDLSVGSISMWVKFDRLASALMHMDTISIEGYISMHYSYYGDIIEANIYDSGGAKTASTAVSLSANRWYYLTQTWDGSFLRVYLDGVLSGSIAAGQSTRLDGANRSVNIGATYAPSWYVDGLIDDVRIYNRALTAEEITTIYNMENSPATFITWGDEEDVSQAQFTLSAWVKPTNSIASKALAVKDQALRLVTDASGNPACQIYSTSGWQTAATATDALTLNSWQYVSCAYDRSNIKLYTNGVLQATQTMSNVDIYDTGNALELGRDAGGSYTDFQGYIDEFKFYKYARSAAQIKADYTGVSTPKGASTRSVTVGESRDASEGLVAHWKMDDNVSGNGQTIVDSSGNGNTGTTNDGANDSGMDCTVAGRYGRACDFDGTDDYVDLGNSIFSSGGPITTDDFTITFWSYSSNASNKYILSKYADSNNRILLLLLNNQIYLKMKNGGTEYVEIDTGFSAGVMPSNTWTLFTFVCQRGSTGKLYRNGVTLTLSTATCNSGDVSNSANLLISGWPAGPAYWPGLIDDVRIYNRALSAQEIRQLYEASPPPVMHLKLDEKSGQTLYDSSGANDSVRGFNTGSASDDPTWKGGGDCMYGACLEFDGVDDYVSTTDFSL